MGYYITMTKAFNSSAYGKLYIVATPIGNFTDFSARAIETLQQVDLICAEDTRKSGQLLNKFKINTPMRSLHEHNESQVLSHLIDKIKNGENLAIISDAGTPLISDPGFKLVSFAHENNILVSPIPGACAAITALSVAGIASDQFMFSGFLAHKKTKRIAQLEILLEKNVTQLLYEAPHRIIDTLEDIAHVFGTQQQICIARELTKTYETILRGQVADVLLQLTSDPQQQKGEFVIVIAPIPKKKLVRNISPQTLQLLKHLLQELSIKQAVHLTAKISGERKKLIYQTALELNSASSDK